MGHARSGVRNGNATSRVLASNLEAIAGLHGETVAVASTAALQLRVESLEVEFTTLGIGNLGATVGSSLESSTSDGVGSTLLLDTDVTAAVLQPTTVGRVRGNAELIPVVGVRASTLGVRGQRNDSLVGRTLIEDESLGDLDLTETVSGNLLGSDTTELSTLGSSLNSHAEVTGKRESSQRLHSVVLQPWDIIGVDDVAPDGLGLGVGILERTEQIVTSERLKSVLLASTRLEPVLVVSEGVRSEVSDNSRLDTVVVSQVDVGKVDLVATVEQVTSQLEGAVGGVSVADKGREVLDVGGSLLANVLENLLDGTLKSSVGTKLNNDVGLAILVKLLESRAEENRLGQVVNPVLSTEGSSVLELLTKKRRIELDSLSGLSVDILDVGQVLVGTKLHVRRVVSNIDAKLAVEGAAALKLGSEGINGRLVTRGGDGVGRVLASNSDTRDAKRLDDALDLGRSGTDSQHGSLEAGVVLLDLESGLTTVVGGSHGTLERESTGSVSSSHFTTGVTNDHVGLDIESAEQVDETKLDSGADGLRDVSLANNGLLLGLDELLEQREGSANGLQVVGGSLEGVVEDGVGVEQLLAELRPLSTLTSEDESQLGRGVGGTGGEGIDTVEGSSKLVARGGGQGNSPGVVSTSLTESVGNVAHEALLEDLGVLLNVDTKVGSNTLGGILVVGRKNDELGSLVLGFLRKLVNERNRSSLQNNVGVGTTEAKVVDGDVLFVSGPWADAGRDLHVPLLERDGRVGLFEVDVGQDEALLEHQGGLDDGNDTRGIFQVTDVGLDGSHVQREALGAAIAEDALDGTGLDGVTDLGTGSVGLDESGVEGRDAGTGVNIADKLLLGFAVGGGNTCMTSVVSKSDTL